MRLGYKIDRGWNVVNVHPLSRRYSRMFFNKAIAQIPWNVAFRGLNTNKFREFLIREII